MNTGNLLPFLVYACETDLLTDEQRESFDYEPTITILVPESIAQAFYEDADAALEVSDELKIPVRQATFSMWHDAVYTADSVVGLWSYSVNHGFTPIRA